MEIKTRSSLNTCGFFQLSDTFTFICFMLYLCIKHNYKKFQTWEMLTTRFNIIDVPASHHIEAYMHVGESSNHML